ncbi:MAG: hypothetical protein Q4A69_04860 [Moraxella sp.]|nr:hypothetical protein [Moraxella sp.]
MLTLKKTFMLTVLTALSGVAMADSYWNHNGSTMRLVADGNERAFYYEIPSSKMKGTGVTAGTLLFDGYRQGNKYYGTARVFSKYCDDPLQYPVQGTVKNETTVVMTGRREVYAAGCRPTGKMTTDKLVFTYQYSD